MSNQRTSLRFSRTLRIALGIGTAGAAVLGIWIVRAYADAPSWEFGMRGFAGIAFALLGACAVVAALGGAILQRLACLERKPNGLPGRWDACLLYSFSLGMVVCAVCIFGWIRGFCREAPAARVESPPLDVARGKGGFTMLEMLISITIVLILAGLVTAMAFKVREGARAGVANTTIQGLYVAIDAYELENGAWPTRLSADDVHLNFDASASPLKDSDKALNLLNTYYQFDRAELDESADPKLLDPWGSPFFFQIFDLASTDADELAAAQWWEAQNLSHPVKIYSVGLPGNLAATPGEYSAGRGYWVNFNGVSGQPVIYANELQEIGK